MTAIRLDNCSKNVTQIVLAVTFPHVRFRRGFLNLEVTSRPAQRDTTDRGCFYRNHSQTSLIFHLSFPFFFFVSRSPVLLPCQTPWHQRRYGNGGGMMNLHLCLIINSMVIKYSHSCRVESPNLKSSAAELTMVVEESCCCSFLYI